MLVYLFSSNYSNPSTGGGISSDLCRSNSLGTSHSRHESESEWLAVSSTWLESVKSPYMQCNLPYQFSICFHTWMSFPLLEFFEDIDKMPCRNVDCQGHLHRYRGDMKYSMLKHRKANLGCPS